MRSMLCFKHLKFDDSKRFSCALVWFLKELPTSKSEDTCENRRIQNICTKAPNTKKKMARNPERSSQAFFKVMMSMAKMLLKRSSLTNLIQLTKSRYSPQIYSGSFLQSRIIVKSASLFFSKHTIKGQGSKPRDLLARNKQE